MTKDLSQMCLVDKATLEILLRKWVSTQRKFFKNKGLLYQPWNDAVYLAASQALLK